MARISSSCSAMRLGVNPFWKSCLTRSCLGGSMPMNIARESSIGKIDSLIAVTPPSSDEYVAQSRLTVAMSSGRVTDQKPFSCGNSLISEVQCTGQLARSSLNSSCGGPSSHRSRSRTRTSFREEAGWAAIPARYRKLDTLSGARRAARSDADDRQPAAQLAARQRALLADRAAQQLGVVRPAVGRG